MTYLEAVNSVLRRLREDEVVSVSANPYSKLVGELVNDAKRIVEDAWDWSSLRNTITVQTTEDIFSYNLLGTNTSFKIIDVINDTSNYFMEVASVSEMNNYFLNQDPPKSSPNTYSWNGFNADGNAIVDIYPVPNGVYDLRFNIVQRQDGFTEDSDVFNVPYQAVVQLAQGFAMEERGETGGQTGSAMLQLGRSTLADAIAFDAARYPSETVWREV